MPNYYYSAKSVEGKNQTGTMEARDEHALAQELKNNDLILIRAVLEDKKNKNIFSFFTRSAKISLSEKLMITRNLQIMVSTGLPLVKSFSLLAGQAKNKGLKRALLDIKEEIGRGESLADSFSKYPQIFSEIFRSMIALGEASGTMENVLQILSLQIEKEHQLKSKIKRALIYPTILSIVMLCAGGIVMTVFVPQIKILFQGLNVELPIYTKALIGMGDFMTQYWYFVLLFIFLLIPIIFKILKTKKGKWAKDTALINLPYFSALVKKTNAALLIRSLSSLISSGIPLAESLQITSRTVSNGYFERALIEAAEKIKKGEELSDALKIHKNIFPFGALETIEIGEETGETATILKKLADFYEEEVIRAADNLSVMIEPILIVFLGIAVGIFALAIMSPLYSVLGTIH